MKKVYIAAPYTQGDVAQNVQRVILAADVLYNAGFIPFVPHLTHFWHLVAPRPYDQWLKYDNEWLKACDIVLRLEGDSAGADKEVTLARKLHKPIFFDLDTLLYSQ